MTMQVENKPKERCPYRKGTQVAYDEERDEIYEGEDMCSLTDKWCLLGQDLPCETYDEYLKELEDKE